jgi:uncharacterized cupredoxin-like copper-binding protein
VTFLLTNLGSVVHEFAVGPADKFDADEIGEHPAKTVTYTFDGSGPYALACHEPGHFETGMGGTVAFTD